MPLLLSAFGEARCKTEKMTAATRAVAERLSSWFKACSGKSKKVSTKKNRGRSSKDPFDLVKNIRPEGPPKEIKKKQKSKKRRKQTEERL